MKSSTLLGKLAAIGALAILGGNASAGPVYFDGGFSNPSLSNQGAPVGASGWYFNNVRAGGVVAVDVSHPRSGDGSVSMAGPVNAKADIEYLPNAVNTGGNYASGGSLGALSALSSMQYDWYRDSASAANTGQHPSLRVLIDTDGSLATTSDRGGLVFERAYNGGGAVPNDAWASELITDSTYMWNFGTPKGNAFNINGTPYAFDATLGEWKAYFPNAIILGFSSGIGSGWGSFSGAVDNIGWTIGGVSTVANFEVAPAAAVPEPGTLALLALSLFGIGMARRRR